MFGHTVYTKCTRYSRKAWWCRLYRAQFYCVYRTQGVPHDLVLGYRDAAHRLPEVKRIGGDNLSNKDSSTSLFVNDFNSHTHLPSVATVDSIAVADCNFVCERGAGGPVSVDSMSIRCYMWC